MRQILFYYYNINFEIEYENAYIYILKYNNELFIFKRVEIDFEILKENITILNNYHIRFHNIIINTKNELISTIKNHSYVLLKVDKTLENNWIDFSILDVDYHTIDIGSIWIKKIDYYTKVIGENDNKDIMFNSIFHYYIGMSENAVAIANRLKNNNVSLKRVLEHKRVDYPFNYLKYYDPTEMLLDFRIRDYSEYLKSKILKENINIMNEYQYILSVNYTNDEINILLARLLYPSYYFDLLDRWLEKEIDVSELLKFTDVIEKYEQFLKELVSKLSERYSLYIIDWIKK